MPQVGPTDIVASAGESVPDAGIAPVEETLPAISCPAAPALLPIDAFEPDDEELVEGAPDAALLSANAPLPEEDFQTLESEVGKTRIVYLHGEPAVPVSALIALGGALLFHALFMCLFLLALFSFAKKGGTGDDADSAANAGGSGDGYMVTGEGPVGTPSLAPGVEELLAHAVTPPVPQAPALPPPPDASVPGESLAVAELAAPQTDVSIIGIASGDDRSGQLRLPPPPEITRRPAPNNTLIVAPPEKVPLAKQPATSPPAGAKGTLAAATHAGVGTGGGDDDYGDETVLPLLRADAGDGAGGHGNHGGLDRGGSGANNPEPMLLEWNMPAFDQSVYLNPPPRSTQCRVTVRADGTVGKVEIVQSCGQKDLDEMWKASLAKGKYRPAYRAGKPYEADKTVDCGFQK